MVSSSSKSQPQSAPSPSATATAAAAYDFTAISTALGQVNESIPPCISASSSAAYDMTGLSEALGEADQRQRIFRLARLHEQIWEPLELKKRDRATRIMICNIPTYKAPWFRINLGKRGKSRRKQKESSVINAECLRLATEELDRTFSSLMKDQNQKLQH